MKNENDPSASASATTSPHGQPKADPKDAKKPSEADYLSRQQQQARAAISGTLADMKLALAQGVDIREWTRQHPWILMGAAAATGAVAAVLTTPSKDESLKEFFEEKWEGIKDRFTPDPPAEPAAARADAPPAEKSSVVGTILREAMKVVGPALGGLITSYMANQAENAPQDGHNGNGHSEPRETAPED